MMKMPQDAQPLFRTSVTALGDLCSLQCLYQKNVEARWIGKFQGPLYGPHAFAVASTLVWPRLATLAFRCPATW